MKKSDTLGIEIIFEVVLDVEVETVGIVKWEIWFMVYGLWS